ncbi:MAG: hypothetical protein L3J34_02615 [Flavobacteriaceae bacterium]|nr:hypothetical protein [Flavobacteriaceae bacterium]
MEKKNKIDKTSQTQQEEEVDLGNLFIVIGKGFRNFFNFFGNIFKSIFHYFILFLIFLRSHALKLGVALILGFVVGFILHKLDKKTYVSNMIIETNYGSGIQLYKQINYLNDLVEKKDSLSLSHILTIEINDAAQINKIQVSAYQSKNNLYRAFDEYMRKTDTVFTRGFEFDDYVKRLAEYDLRYHTIQVNSKLKTVFAKLSPSLIRLVENDYYKNVKNLKVNELLQKLKVLNKNLTQIDSLRKTYKEVALKEAENKSGASTIEIAKTNTNKEQNDIKLFETTTDILDNISLTNNALIRKNNVVNIISDFDEIGVPDKNLIHKKYIQFALLFGGLMLGWILIKQLNNYLKNYRG